MDDLNYRELLKCFQLESEKYRQDDIYEHTIECMFESMRDWSQFHTIVEVRDWFEKKKSGIKFEVEEIPLNEVKNWRSDERSGNISHISGDFFIIHGVRVSTENREVESGWDQPILRQIGYDGGLLGLIRKRFNGVPHYLCEAKVEPGNYGKVQLSPSLQATFSNINKAHLGRSPHFCDLFVERYENPHVKVLFDAWLSEDGGRLHLKRNRGILIEMCERETLKLPSDNFIWLSLYQIKILLKEDAWINPHVRGILAHV